MQTMSVHALKTRRASRQEAHEWLRAIFAPNCAIVQDAALSFCDEWSRHQSGEQIWALPETDRAYFIVGEGKTPLLLAGLNSHCGLSSFMKLDWSEEHIGIGKECVRALIEKELVKLCRERGKPAFSAHTATERSWKLFRGFIVDLPKGIIRVETTTAGFTLYIS